MPIEYTDHGGARIAVVWCPAVCPDRLTHLSIRETGAWVLRDFVGRRKMNHSPTAPSTSPASLEQIESLVEAFESPPRYAVYRAGEWASYLRTRSLAYRERPPKHALKSPLGGWQPLKESRKV